MQPSKARCTGCVDVLCKASVLVAECALLLAQVKKTVNMRLAVLVLSVLLVSVASRQLQDIDADSALEHQRILAELEEVHQLRERMLQQGMTLSEMDCFASVLQNSRQHMCSDIYYSALQHAEL